MYYELRRLNLYAVYIDTFAVFKVEKYGYDLSFGQESIKMNSGVMVCMW